MRKSLAAFCLEKGLQELLGQWDQERNAPLTPETISYGSKRKVWWRCSKGHEWLAPPYARTGSETGCPYCAGKLPIPGETDLGTLFPNLTREWHPAKNGIARQSPESMVALCQRPRLDGPGKIPGQRLRMPGVRQQSRGAGANGSGDGGSGGGSPVAPRQKRNADAAGRPARHDAQGLVALRKGPRLAGIGVCAGAAGGRMPLLYRQKGTARGK